MSQKKQSISQLAKELAPYLVSSSGTSGTVASGGVTDHGLLTNLTGDHHKQYLTVGRGDARYMKVNEAGEVAEHGIVGSKHTASGLTTGHFMRANSATTFDFEQITLADIDIVGGDGIDITGNTISVDLYATNPYLTFSGGKLLALASTNVNANSSRLIAADSNGRFTADGITLEYLFSPTDTDLIMLAGGTGTVEAQSDLVVIPAKTLYASTIDTESGGLTITAANASVGVTGSLTTTAAATVGTDLQVDGDVILTDFATISSASSTLSANLTTGKSLLFEANGTDALRVASDADVRVIAGLKVGADTDPSYTLDVSGTANISGNVYANSNLIVTGDVDAANADIPGTLELGTLTSQAVGSDLNIAANKVQFQSYAGGDLLEMLSDGTFRSDNFDAVSTDGWSLGPTFQDLGNANIRGSLSTAVLEYQQLMVGAGQQLFRPGGKLHNDLAINTTAGNYTYTIDITNPADETAIIAVAGDWLYMRGTSYSAPATASTGSSVDPWSFSPAAASAQTINGVRYAWFKIVSSTAESGYYSYECTLSPTVSSLGLYTFAAGAAVANLGADGEGAILIDGDNGPGPFMDIRTLSETAGVPSNTSHVRLGALVTSSLGNANEWGMIAAADLQSSATSYLIASNQRLEMRNPELKIVDVEDETATILGTSGLYLRANSVDYNSGGRVDAFGVFDRTEGSEINFSFDVDGADDSNTIGSLYARRLDTFFGNAGVPPFYQTEHIWNGETVLEAQHPSGVDLDSNTLILRNKFQIDDDDWNVTEIRLAIDESWSSINITAEKTLVNGDFESTGRIRAKNLPTSIVNLENGDFYVDDDGFVKVIQ